MNNVDGQEIIYIFIAELRKRWGKESDGLEELFLEGRSKATIRQYDGAYRKWKTFLEKEGRTSWVSDELTICKYLRELEKKKLGEGSVTQFLAMMTLMGDLRGDT